ncbi:MAG: two-component system response regulator CreB [Acidobacteria bacterium]|nr:two-component system response regulator CreB [Acidobacteriota bacterium]
MTRKILIIEDEPGVADTLLYALKTEGFQPIWCDTGSEGLKALDEQGIDLVILDIGLPDGNGFEFFREIRGKHSVPVIFLTARSEEVDRVLGLELGGDDYVTKPFSPREVTARVKAVLRRISGGKDASKTSSSRFQVDEDRKRIAFFGTALELSRYEYRILRALIRRPGMVFKREVLMELAWDVPDISGLRTVDTHIKTIRHKLREIRSDSDPIRTHRGFGYSLEEDS